MEHTLPVVYDQYSTILILGSFPSVASRKAGFYYHHPQNRFWKLLGKCFDVEIPTTIQAKKYFLLEHHIALWDVVKSCEIIGSSDKTISKVIPNDLELVLKHASIQRIIANGQTAAQLYQKFCFEHTQRPIIVLPSTSPANAKMNIENLKASWGPVLIMDGSCQLFS